jgi:hypothetical protein
VDVLNDVAGPTRIAGQYEQCSQMDCPNNAYVGVNGIPYCDHHARDIALQIDPDSFPVDIAIV